MEQTIDYKGYIIKIEQDDNLDRGPREWDNLTKMICFHRGYDLGDKHDFKNPNELHEWMNEQGDKIEYLPLYLYDHSGITMNTTGFHCPWDSGQVGYIYTDLEMLQYMGHNWARWSTKRRKQAREWMIGDVEVYDQFLRGDVWGYTVEDPSGEHIDSCWGYYGDIGIEDAIGQAKSIIDYELTKEAAA